MFQSMFYKFSPWLLNIKKNHSEIINASIGNHLKPKKRSTTSFSNIHLKKKHCFILMWFSNLSISYGNHKSQEKLLNTKMKSFWNLIEIIKAYCNPWIYVYYISIRIYIYIPWQSPGVEHLSAPHLGFGTEVPRRHPPPKKTKGYGLSFWSSCWSLDGGKSLQLNIFDMDFWGIIFFDDEILKKTQILKIRLACIICIRLRKEAVEHPWSLRTFLCLFSVM